MLQCTEVALMDWSTEPQTLPWTSRHLCYCAWMIHACSRSSSKRPFPQRDLYVRGRRAGTQITPTHMVCMLASCVSRKGDAAASPCTIDQQRSCRAPSYWQTAPSRPLQTRGSEGLCGSLKQAGAIGRVGVDRHHQSRQDLSQLEHDLQLKVSE